MSIPSLGPEVNLPYSSGLQRPSSCPPPTQRAGRGQSLHQRRGGPRVKTSTAFYSFLIPRTWGYQTCRPV